MALTFQYQWLRDGIPISGAESPNYIVTDSDAGHTLTFKVDGVNGYGATVAISLPFVIPPPISPTLPVNTVAPSITAATVGISTVCIIGSWTGTAPITYTFQWYIDGSSVSDQTSTVYTPVSGDAGKSIYCIVTAHNSAGAISAQSNTQTVANSGSVVDVANWAAALVYLNQGPVIAGGVEYRFPAGALGDISVNDYDFTSNPVVFSGPPSGTPATASTIWFAGSGGFTFKDIPITANVNEDRIRFVGNPAVPTIVTINNCPINGGQARGTVVGTGIHVNDIFTGDITYIGKGDAAQPDIWGCGTAILRNLSAPSACHFNFINITEDNLGVDANIGAGIQNETWDGLLVLDQIYGVGDHPDAMQFEDYQSGGTTQLCSNIIIKNSGFQQTVSGRSKQGVFAATGGSGFLMKDSWVFDGIFGNSAIIGSPTNWTFDNVFAQGIVAEGNAGGNLVIESSTNTHVTNCTVGSVIDGGGNTGLIETGTNIITNAATIVDFTQLNIYTASTPTTRDHA